NDKSRGTVRRVSGRLRRRNGEHLSIARRALPDLEEAVDDRVARHLYLAHAGALRLAYVSGRIDDSLPGTRIDRQTRGRRGAASVRALPFSRARCLEHRGAGSETG